MINIKHYIIFLAIFTNVVDCSKILLWPFPYLSHVRELTHIGEGLKQNGHELHLVLPPSLPEIQMFRDERRIQVIEYEMKYKDFNMLYNDEEEFDETLELILTQDPIEDFRENTIGYLESCTNPLEDETLMQRIKKEQYDLAIIDAFPTSRCYFIAMYRLNIPYISVATQYEPWLFRAPALPSFVPFGLRRHTFTDKMTFLERLKNTYSLIRWTAFTEIAYLDDNWVTKYAPEKPFVSINWLAGRSLLWLFDTDIAVDYARPTMANEINIGGLSTKSAKSLPPDLKKFLDDSPEGVILASFGSRSTLANKYMNILIDALKQVKLKVILRYNKEPPKDIPKHMKLQKWVPQNDILAHPNIKLFMTHCGANSQFEGLYHGVPMLNFPVFGDQPYNSIRADYKGFSKSMDILTMTSDDILHNVNAIILNTSYSDNIKKGSEIFRSSKLNPKQRAVYWIEHVLKFGGDHLHSHALDMPWYEYLMLDIMALLLVLIFAIVLFIFLMLCTIIRLCFKSSSSKKIKVN